MVTQNFFRDTETADVLNEIRQAEVDESTENRSNENFILHSLLKFFNQINISNTVNLNNNKHTFANTVNLSNLVFLREHKPDRFLVCESDDEKYLNTGKRINFTGSNYLSITKHTELQPTSALTLAVRASFVGFTGTRREIFHNQNANNGYVMYCEASANNIISEWYSGSALISSQTIGFTPNTYTTFVATFQSGNQNLYKNGTLADSDTTAGTMTASSSDVGIGATAAGSNKMANGDIFQQLVLIDRFVDATWASDYNNAIIKLNQTTDYIPMTCDFALVS